MRDSGIESVLKTERESEREREREIEIERSPVYAREKD